MSNLSSTTSITYTLTPSTFNLFKVEARYFIKRFAWRLNEIRGSSRFEEVHLFQGFWLAERSINDQSEMLSQMSRCDSATRTCLCVHALFCMILTSKRNYFSVLPLFKSRALCFYNQEEKLNYYVLFWIPDPQNL